MEERTQDLVDLDLLLRDLENPELGDVSRCISPRSRMDPPLPSLEHIDFSFLPKLSPRWKDLLSPFQECVDEVQDFGNEDAFSEKAHEFCPALTDTIDGSCRPSVASNISTVTRQDQAIGSVTVNVPYPPRQSINAPYQPLPLKISRPSQTFALERWPYSCRSAVPKWSSRSREGFWSPTELDSSTYQCRQWEPYSAARADSSDKWLKKFEEGGPLVTPDGKEALQCQSCCVFRRVIHSNGVHDTKLEIHSHVDVSRHHAVLHTRRSCDSGLLAVLEQQVEEIPALGNPEDGVKQFLWEYDLLRQKEGFVRCYDSQTSNLEGIIQRVGTPANGIGLGMGILRKSPQPMLHDNMQGFHGTPAASSSHSAILSGLTSPKVTGEGSQWSKPSDSGPGLLQRRESSNSVTCDPAQHLGQQKPGGKSLAAAQRERTNKLQVEDLAKFFHLPINLAARELGICPTVLKKICRRNNMRRWPHRKIKSIERIIATLEQTLAEGVTSGEATIRSEIAQLQMEKDQLCAGILGDL